MHKSQLAGFSIDCKGADPDEAAQFWSAALGCKAQSKSQANDPIYRSLESGRDDLYIEVQHVQHESRVHLDIESDDIEAEVRRLESLGARRVEFVKEWWVMEAPTGHRFCVVKPESRNFDETATQW